MSDIPAGQPVDIPDFTRAPDYKVLYSNFFRTRVGVGEVIMVFSQFTHTPGLNVSGSIIEEKAEVTMAWAQIKVLASQLGSLVQAIEEELGPIPVPNGLVGDQYEANQMIAQRRVVQSLGLVTQGPFSSSPEPTTPPESPAQPRSRRRTSGKAK